MSPDLTLNGQLPDFQPLPDIAFSFMTEPDTEPRPFTLAEVSNLNDQTGLERDVRVSFPENVRQISCPVSVSGSNCAGCFGYS